MLQEEKDRLIALFKEERNWCREADATDAEGQSVRYDNEQAVSWDLVGGLCHLFGWKRASQLFGPISRHLTGKKQVMAPVKNQEMTAMTVLLNFNDDTDTTYERLMERLHALPVWHGHRQTSL